MRRSIVAVEDQRFWSESGVDFRGIARALVADVTGGATQGGSTITEQFVKNALAQEDNDLLEKLREAALAFQLAHRWPKTKILTQYLNSIYFGNGAYGIEPAARCTSATSSATTSLPRPRRTRAPVGECRVR